MKKYILSGLIVALALILAVSIWPSGAEGYIHIDYVSRITSEDCFLCGGDGAQPWGEDNVGILDLNTFELL